MGNPGSSRWSLWSKSEPPKLEEMFNEESARSDLFLTEESEELSERLHKCISKDQLEKLHSAFLNTPERQVGIEGLRIMLEDLDVMSNDSMYTRLFLKINQNRDFKVDWNEFVSYLIYGFQEEDPSSQKESLVLPISGPPMVRKSEHRSAICCLALLKGKSDQVPIDKMTETVIFSFGGEDSPEASGMWVTASHEGMMRFWTSHMEPIRTASSESRVDEQKAKLPANSQPHRDSGASLNGALMSESERYSSHQA
ncbi:WD repeat-containing protein on Y chromosome-like [Drosophila gunungcola]|uniref:WD repeat-containing protein on Y chromosome-like n=1 Tax=Drosophila gunungcola TaxID=103775 RepID=UPI0022E8AC56|nr:WD repeat-containing protein on Y chromosome-like [Drosophila gunungcola]